MRPKKTILCVDDNEQALSVRKFMLDTRGYRVLTALTGAEALEFVSQGGIDLVLSDLIMPLMDGNELVRRIKEIAPDVPTLLISGTVKSFDRASNADAFMPKGCCSPLELLERIRLMIARKRGPKKHSSLRQPMIDNINNPVPGQPVFERRMNREDREGRAEDLRDQIESAHRGIVAVAS